MRTTKDGRVEALRDTSILVEGKQRIHLQYCKFYDTGEYRYRFVMSDGGKIENKAARIIEKKYVMLLWALADFEGWGNLDGGDMI